MAITKQSLPINFLKGLDLKGDPFQIAPGAFLSLENSVFTKAGLLQKRNGFGELASLPPGYTYATTYNDSLVAIGEGLPLQDYSTGTASWNPKGNIQPCQVSVLPIYRSGTTQTYADFAQAESGLICTVFTDNVPVSGSNTLVYKYLISDPVTGSVVVAPTTITSSYGTVQVPKVWNLGNYFVVVFRALSGSTLHLQYIAISAITPSTVVAATDISSLITGPFEGIIANDQLYLSWGNSTSVKTSFLSSTLVQSNTVTTSTGVVTNFISVCADTSGSTPVIWTTIYNTAAPAGYTFALTSSLNSVLTATEWTTAATIVNIASTATAGLLTIYYETTNAYSYDSGVPSNFLSVQTMTHTGTAGTSAVFARSVGLASKAIAVNGNIYFLVAYTGPYQSTYFLWSYTLMHGPIAKVAYGNGGGYCTTGLPNMLATGTTLSVPYLYKDSTSSINEGISPANGNTNVVIYSNLGVQLASFALTTSGLYTAEIANNLHINGGFLWLYDGSHNVVEHNFHLYPDSIEATWSTSGGAIHAQPDGSTNTDAYQYQVTYEYSDNQGQVHRSAPSTSVFVSTSGSGTAGSITVNIPTLRLTYKTANPVKICIYRWSVFQEDFYEVTSVLLPTLNNTTVDSIAFVDTLADASIDGNTQIYTEGGVVEDIGPPACTGMTLFDDRLWLIDAEDQNLLWYSKQVLENTPVEMSDLFTTYVAPSQGAQGSTGTMTALSAMDSSLIIWKKDAIYYIQGSGPDNTGANSGYTQPIFITSTVGTIDQSSIAFIPSGLMFQSDKGIWLLGRDLQTSYLGSPVEGFNADLVESSLTVPGTNQCRFTLSTGVSLMYDYYYNAWGSFVGIPAVSSTLFQGLHTFINSYGQVYQETPGLYLDGSNPTLLQFQTGWFNLMGLQGYERAYYFYLLGTYLSPHKLLISIAYDYNPSPQQQVLIYPNNFSGSYGSDTLYGGSQAYGGVGNIEQFRVFFEQGKCQAFQLTFQEINDPNMGGTPGAGISLSGINLVYAGKKPYPSLPAAQSVG